MNKMVATLAALLFACLPLIGMAENSTSIPGYIIHHNALPTDTLSPEVARHYGLTRSKNRGMLNVSVIKGIPGTTGQPVKAQVSAQATNLAGQSREIELREIIDGDAIYYIGDFRVADQETLNFTLQVTPEGSTESYSARLSQQFFIQ